MRRRLAYRPWLRGPRARVHIPSPGLRRGRRFGRGILLPVLLGVGLALLLIHGLDTGTRPLIEEMAQVKAQNAVAAMVNRTVNQTLADGGVGYTDLVTLQTDNAGAITAMTTNSARINALRAELLEEILRQVDSLDSTDLGVPLGNLTGISSLSGWGPALPVRVLSEAAADAVFRNDFSAAGINQTLHRIMLDVTVEIKLLIPGGTVETAVHTEVCVAETVIVGEVPSAYLQWN